VNLVRAIDADALQKEYMHEHDGKRLMLIDVAPTIEPRKKGKWIKKTIKKKIENDYSCSECGRHVSVMRGYDVRMVYPFCHCGADMTEGKE
jgi:hypothetical protein